MNATVEIFSQGHEVVSGQVTDTNAAWLAQQLTTAGFTVSRHTAVGDKLADLIAVLGEIAARSPVCCICSGGLGPTCDDLTAEAVAAAFDMPLQFDSEAFAQISRYYQSRNKPMPEINRKQAMLPQGAARIDNSVGTAPGFHLVYQNCWFVFLPGVPTEMQHLFTQTVSAELKQRFVVQPPRLVTLHTRGIGESRLQELLNQLTLPEPVELGFRAADGVVQVKLHFPNVYPFVQVEKLVTQVQETIGDGIFAIEGLVLFGADSVYITKKCHIAI
jgi:nicotinamide-nucleotide amidase